MTKLDDMIRTEGYHIYEGKTVSNLQYRIINHRLFNDVDQVTHQDRINCFYEYVDLYVDMIRDQLNKEIEKLEQYHEENGSLNEVVIDFKEVIEQ